LISSLSFQSCQEATAPFNSQRTTNNDNILAKKQLKKLNDLGIISSHFADILVNDNIKAFLEQTIENANTKERILDGKEFFNKNISFGHFQNTTLAEIMISNAKKNVKTELSNILQQLKNGEVDVYFPVKGHFEKWLKNKNNIYVGYSISEREWEPVTVFDLKGNSFQLSATETPNIPVLMIIPCEHRGNHKLPTKSRVNSQQIVGDDDDGGGGYGGGGVPNHNRVDGNPEILSTVELYEDGESWFKGDPEIYYVIAAQIAGEIDRTYLPNVNDENHVYTLNREMFDWHWSYGDYYKIRFAEEDNGGYTVGANAYGVGFNISIKDDDDDLGMKIVNKDDAYNKNYNTGYVSFYIKYQE